MTPAKAIIPMNEVVVKNAPNNQCPRTIPIKESGMATIMTIGVLKVLEPTYNQHVNNDNYHCKSSS